MARSGGILFRMSNPNDRPADSHPPEDDGNFLHVVIYAGIFLVIGLIVAFVIIKGVGRHLVPGKHDPHPTSQLVIPIPTTNAPEMSLRRNSELPFTISQQTRKTCV
ncbi:MAG TPA: hypothetical protein VMU57_01860 [Edaphobacter sp.]|uniref:hypothetical protein n=1 Tax=Edaphobacter sp. TaxID=1934404 RepID=UPI002C9CBA3D|nr:hypothetical protein [Edaphobacter sp.]HUZ93638.1 hypothetical protein [Edaphobacter sp.]